MVGLTFQHLDGGASTNALKLYPPSKLRLVTFYSRIRIKFIWRWSVLYFKLLTFPTCMSAALYNGTCLKNLLIFPTRALNDEADRPTPNVYKVYKQMYTSGKFALFLMVRPFPRYERGRWLFLLSWELLGCAMQLI